MTTKETTGHDKELEIALKKASPSVQRYVAKLEAINVELHEKIAEFKAQQFSLKSEIKALEKQLKNQGIPDLGEILRRRAQREGR